MQETTQNKHQMKSSTTIEKKITATNERSSEAPSQQSLVNIKKHPTKDTRKKQKENRKPLLGFEIIIIINQKLLMECVVVV